MILREFTSQMFLKSAFFQRENALKNAKASLAKYKLARNPKHPIIKSRIMSLEKVIIELGE